MKVLIVGSGAREHALAWRLGQSPSATGIWVANGNAGTGRIATNLGISPEDVEGVVGAAQALGIDLVVVGPEGPLALGMVDRRGTVPAPHARKGRQTAPEANRLRSALPRCRRNRPAPRGPAYRSRSCRRYSS